MTAGTPTAHLSADHRRRAHAQALEIHGMLARNVPHRDIAAAVGCSLMRVVDVAQQPTPVALDDPWNDEPAVTVPTPRVTPERTAQARTAGFTASADAVLTRAARIDDPRIQARVDHILDDLSDLIAVLGVHDDLAHVARLAADADRRAEALRRTYEQRHPGRRRTDTALEAS